MRNVILSQLMTLDAMYAGLNGNIDWHTVDAEFDEVTGRQFKTMDMFLFGRITYEVMVAYWPTAEAMANDPETAKMMNETPKVVFSKTLDTVDWQHTRLVKTDLVEEVKRLKQQDGGDIVILGSGQIVSVLMAHGLIDLYRLFINPWILGRGQALFAGIDAPTKLALVNTHPFKNGVVELDYAPIDA